MIGVEILEASSFLRDTVLESIQARPLRVLEATGVMHGTIQLRNRVSQTELLFAKLGF